jgi:RHS repeat-associated protein
MLLHLSTCFFTGTVKKRDRFAIFFLLYLLFGAVPLILPAQVKLPPGQLPPHHPPQRDTGYSYFKDDSVPRLIPLNAKAKPVSTANARTAVATTSAATAQVARMIAGPQIPTSFDPDRSKAVGEIPIQSGTTATGAVTYTVPIQVAPGRNGAQPQISLQYSSQAGNTNLGTGWAVGGLSMITASNANMYYDGKTDGIKLTKDDVFYLDGVRLIKLSDNGSQVDYETEQGNIKVSGFEIGTSPRFIHYFKVYYPSGTTAIFGYENGFSNRVDYPIEKSVDANGNTVVYNWGAGYNERDIILNIQYGNAKVEFNYIDIYNAHPVPSTFTAGQEFSIRDRLESITCKYNNGAELRTYQLEYDDIYGNIALLKKIKCSAGGNELNPLSFEYGDGTTTASINKQNTQLWEWFPNTTVSNLKINRGKFDYGTNNDGLIVYPNLNPYYERYVSGGIFSHSQKWYQNNFNPAQMLLVYQGLQNPYSDPPVELTAGDGFINLFAADIDGKPGDEVIKINNTQSNGWDHVTFDIYASNLYTGLGRIRNFSIDFAPLLDWYGTKSVAPKYFYAGDFNGDGRSEILVVSANNALGNAIPSTTYLVDANSGSIIYQGSGLINLNINLASPGGSTDDKIMVMDKDGDGKDDICLIAANGAHLYTFDASGSSYSLSETGGNSSLSTGYLQYKSWYIAELNGDGKPDFVIAPAASYSTETLAEIPVYAPRYCWLCGAQGSWNNEWTPGQANCYVCGWQLYATTECYECQRRLDDVWNEDANKWDHVCPEHGATTWVTRPVYVDNGNTWDVFYNTGKDLWWRNITIKNFDEDEKVYFQDMNGDGLSDLVSNMNGTNVYLNIAGAFDGNSAAYHPDGTGSYVVPVNIAGYNYNSQLLSLDNDQVHKFSFTRNDVHQRLLTGAINSQGVITKNSYAYLNENVYQYGSGNSIYTPGYGATFPYENYQGPFTVVTNAQTWLNNVKQTDLSYTYNNAILHRQGLGFLGFTSIQVYDDKRGLTLTRTNDPYQFGLVKKEESTASVTTYDYNNSIDPNKIARIRLTKRTATDLLKNTTVTTTYGNDGFGNVTSEVVDYGGGLKTTTNTSYYNEVTATKNVIGVPLSQTITSERNGASQVSDASFTYNAQYDPISKTSTTGGNTAKQETWAYDAYGNVIEEKTKAYAAPAWMVTTHEYDANGMFRTKTTNPLSQATLFAYNADGTLQTKTDFKGNVTSYTYDIWQRLLTASNPDGTTQTTTYDWQPAGSDRLYSIKQEITGKPTSQVHYDAMNRKVRSTLTGFDGADVSTDQTYDDLGRELATSQPFKNGANGWSTKSYDQYDRLTQVSMATGADITYSYSGNSVTETKNGVSETKTFDGMGKPASNSNSTGTVTYSLRPDGQPDHISAPGGTTSFTYDSYGRQTGMQDPAAGSTQYAYDNAGNVNSQTDANNKTIQSTFDNFNRIVNKTTPEFSTTYSYNTDGSLQSAVSTNGTSKTYVYDNLGRVLQVREETGTEYYQANYTYQNGQLQQVVHTPVNYTVNYLYNSYGYLYKLTDAASQTIRTINKVNVYGKEEERLLGNGFLETRSFDANGFLTGMKTSYGSTVLRNLEMSFDNLKGNLTYRKDVNRGITENFGYDQMDRLTDYGVAAGAQHIDYNNGTGNITRKTDAGNYNYNISGNPYAVSSVISNGSALPLLQQYVTYASFARPLTITYGPDATSGYAAGFTYNDSYDRAKMEMKDNGNLTYTRYYFAGGQYEKTVNANGTTQSLFYIDGSPYEASTVQEYNNGITRLLYISRDQLGSITHITDANRALLAEYNYDAWGRLRNPDTWVLYAPTVVPALLLHRGYTGHEVLSEVGLINMNARLYDPLLGKMLSPDTYVQENDNTQSFNRYAYSLNNPLKYKDPSGNFFIIDDFFIGLAKGAILSVFGQHEGNHRTVLGDAWASALRNSANAARIWGGMFTTNNQHGFWSRTWEIVSRFTWQSPQTALGLTGAHLMNMFGTVRKVDYFDGATVLQGDHPTLWWGAPRAGTGMTLGNFIMGSQDIAAELNNPLFEHEYGHYLQSQRVGVIYMPKFAIPSLFSKNDNPNDNPVEQDANSSAMTYFHNNYALFNFADFERHNPIHNFNSALGYNDPRNQAALHDARIYGNWYDYVPPFFATAEAIYYTFHYRNMQ